MNWSQYRFKKTELKVESLGNRHPKDNWWNGFFRDAEIETLIVTESGEAIPIKGLFIVVQVETWPHFNDKNQMWMVSVISSSVENSTDIFEFKGICDLGFKDYAEAGQVKKGSLFYEQNIVNSN